MLPYLELKIQECQVLQGSQSLWPSQLIASRRCSCTIHHHEMEATLPRRLSALSKNQRIEPCVEPCFAEVGPSGGFSGGYVLRMLVYYRVILIE